jgi:hypothetical protein
MTSSPSFRIAYDKEYRDLKERLEKACGFEIDPATNELRINPNAKPEDIEALWELNRAEAAAIQQGLQKKLAEGAKLANTAASLHDDKHLDGVLGKKDNK